MANMVFRYGFLSFVAKLVLEWPLDLLRGYWIGEYDIHGLGILCGDDGAGCLVY